jgi:hypothetical protein
MNRKPHRNYLFPPLRTEAPNWNAAQHLLAWSDLGRAVEEAWGRGPHEKFGSWADLAECANAVRARHLLSLVVSILGGPQKPGTSGYQPDNPLPDLSVSLAEVATIFRQDDWVIFNEAMTMLTFPWNGVVLVGPTGGPPPTDPPLEFNNLMREKGFREGKFDPETGETIWVEPTEEDDDQDGAS